MKNTHYSSFIKKKYKSTLSDLALHYCIICGELSNEFIDSVFGKNNWKYIAYKSKYKGLFIPKQKDNRKGFQLSKKAKKFINLMPYDYTPYLRPDGELREVTTDLFKRERYRNALSWYYLLDQWGIEYLHERINYNDYYFVDSRLIKNYFDRTRNQFAGSKDKNFQIAGSKSYGILKCSDSTAYSIYISNSSYINLSYNTEMRYKLFVTNSCFQDSNIQKYGHAIFLDSELSIQRLFCGTALLLLTDDNVYSSSTKKHLHKMGRFASFMREINNNSGSYDGSAGIPIISIESSDRIDYFFNKSYYKNRYRDIILQKQGLDNLEDEQTIRTQYLATTIYNNLPCVFLMDLDILKFYKIMTYSIFCNVPYCFVCFKSDKDMIEETINKIYLNNEIDIDVNVVAIEDIINKNLD